MKTKRSIFTLITVLSAVLIFSCGKETNNTNNKNNETDKTKITDTTKAPPKSVNTDEMVAKISKYRDDGEKKLLDKSFKKKELELKSSAASEDTKQKWEKVEGYYDGDKLVRIQTYPYKGISERTEEFYVMDGKLVFAFIQDKGPKSEGKDVGQPGKEFYFDNGKLIKYNDTSGEKAKDVEADKKMYEAKLPVEVSELVDLLNAAK